MYFSPDRGVKVTGMKQFVSLISVDWANPAKNENASFPFTLKLTLWPGSSAGVLAILGRPPEQSSATLYAKIARRIGPAFCIVTVAASGPCGSTYADAQAASNNGARMIAVFRRRMFFSLIWRRCGAYRRKCSINPPWQQESSVLRQGSRPQRARS